MIREDVNEVRNVLEKLAERAILEHDFDTLNQIENANTSLDIIVQLYDELRALNRENIRTAEKHIRMSKERA